MTLTSTAINNALKQAAAANGFAVEDEEPDVQTSATVETEPTEETGAPVYEVTGFQPFTVEIAVDDAGKIVSVKVPSHNETPGLGAALIEDTSVFDALVGQDIATAQIDVKSGVTLTSNAINDALKQAAAAALAVDEAAASGVPATGYDVTGFQPFTVMIAVDENGKIASVRADGNNETPGIGGEVLKAENLSTLVGQDIATAKLDAKTGATLTTNAVNDALAQAAAAGTAGEAAPAADEAAAKTYDVTGFQPFTVEIAVDAAGKIVSVKVPAHSETPGLGAALIEDASVFDALVGQNVATAQIDVKSGVTLTSNAINDALKQAAKEVQ